MGNLIKLPEPVTDVKETLEAVMNYEGGLECVIVLAITKNGEQLLRTSTASCFQKAFLTQFLNAWMSKWFRLEDD